MFWRPRISPRHVVLPPCIFITPPPSWPPPRILMRLQHTRDKASEFSTGLLFAWREGNLAIRKMNRMIFTHDFERKRLINTGELSVTALFLRTLSIAVFVNRPLSQERIRARAHLNRTGIGRRALAV